MEAATQTPYLRGRKLRPLLEALLQDPLLQDLPKQPSLREVEALLAMEKGSALRFAVKKMDGSSFDVTVLQSATLGDLKRAVERAVNDKEQESMGNRRISWKQVWTNFCLSYEGVRLSGDKNLLSNWDIRSGDTIAFDYLPHTPENNPNGKRHRRAKRRRLFLRAQ